MKEEAKRIRAQAAMIEHQGLLKQKLKELQKLQQEIQRLQKAVGTQQVRVDVKFIEVALDKLRDAGITLAEFSTLKHGSCPADKDDSNNGNTVTQTGATEGTTANPKDCAAAVQIIDEHGQITKIALELHKKGILKVIASPTLVTLPGRPATVRIGGEFPIIVPQGPEKNTIEYREFGIRMEAVPTIMANGKIRLELSSETAERDFKNTVVTNGIKVPGLNIRRVNTQIETESGKTVVIGGMVTATKTTDADDKTTKRETGLIIVVTPTLISGDSAIQPVSHEIHPQPLPNLSLPPAPIDLPAPPSLRLDGRTLFGPIKIELSLPPLKAEPKPEPELKPESSGPVKFRR